MGTDEITPLDGAELVKLAEDSKGEFIMKAAEAKKIAREVLDQKRVEEAEKIEAARLAEQERQNQAVEHLVQGIFLAIEAAAKRGEQMIEFELSNDPAIQDIAKRANNILLAEGFVTVQRSSLDQPDVIFLLAKWDQAE